MKSDGNVALVGVASLPREMEDDFPEFAEATLKFLKEKYGDRLKSVVVHDDEEHPHLHFTVVPRIGERFEDIHEGIKAKNEAKKEKQKGKAQNIAYISAMREFQDNFYKKVGIKTGLTRLGPGRRRLTRGEWKAEQQQAKAFADAKAVAKKGLKDGYRKGIEKAKTEATEIVAQAQESAKGLGVKMAGWFSGLAGGWHEPSAKAKAEATKVKTEAQKALKEAQKTKEQAKKWADERVATVGNQIVLEKSKNAELEKEVKTKDQKLEDQATLIQWYQKKFGKAPDNLPKIK